MATGSDWFSCSTCLHTTAFILLSTVSLVEMINSKIWERQLCWCAKCSPTVSVRDSTASMLKLPIVFQLTDAMMFYNISKEQQLLNQIEHHGSPHTHRHTQRTEGIIRHQNDTVSAVWNNPVYNHATQLYVI